MTSTSKPVIFFGTEDFSLVALKALVEAGFQISLVVTKPDSPSGRGHKITAPAVKAYAEGQGIPVLQPSRLGDAIPALMPHKGAAGVLVSYGKIIPDSVIELFKPGIINLHPSLLPKYRGPAPIESAILNGDSKTGVTVMKISKDMDAGPIYASAEYPLNGHETGPSLRDALATFGASLLVKTLPAILSGQLEPTPQNEDGVSYTSLLTKGDSVVEPSDYRANQLERRVRAFLSFPKTRVKACEHEIIIVKASVSDQPKSDLDLRCKDGNYLVIERLIAPSGREMSATDFINGYCSCV